MRVCASDSEISARDARGELLHASGRKFIFFGTFPFSSVVRTRGGSVFITVHGLHRWVRNTVLGEDLCVHIS